MPDSLAVVAPVEHLPAQPYSLLRHAPAVGRAEMQARQSVGRGLRYALPHASKMPAQLLLQPELANGDTPDRGGWLTLHTAAGAIGIEDGARLLMGLTGIDPAAVPQRDGHWPVWLAAALAGRLQGTPLASLKALAESPGGQQACGMRLRLTLQQGRHAIHVAACAEPAIWNGLIGTAGHQSLYMPLTAWLPLTLKMPVLLARHHLPLRAFRALAAGDIVLPDDPRFKHDGSGFLPLGARRWRVQYQAPQGLKILAEENSLDIDTMDDTPNTEVADATAVEIDSAADAASELPRENTPESTHKETPESTPEEGTSALSGINLTISFELGRLSLSLEQIRTLGPQSLLALHGAAPDSIAIFCGAVQVGRGEVVALDDKLGIRITHWSGAC